MAGCRQATNYYLGQYWLRSMLPYSVGSPQWPICPCTPHNTWILLSPMTSSIHRHDIKHRLLLSEETYLVICIHDTWLNIYTAEDHLLIPPWSIFVCNKSISCQTTPCNMRASTCWAGKTIVSFSILWNLKKPAAWNQHFIVTWSAFYLHEIYENTNGSIN